MGALHWVGPIERHPRVVSTAELFEGPSGYELLSGIYRNDRQSDHLWFAHRRPDWWTHLDVEVRSNGDLYTEVAGARRAFLLVDGAVAVECRQWHPGVRRLHSMVEHGVWKPPGRPRPPVTWPEPDEIEPTTWERRPAVRWRWNRADLVAEAVLDMTTRIVVRMSAPHETVEITGLRYDDEVDASVFRPPEQSINGWRGGTAHVVRDGITGRCSASWEPRSGPGSLHIGGPSDVGFDEAMRWANARTDDVRISVSRPRS